jgi:hypothetical protein
MAVNNLDKIADQLFNKIRGRFPNCTLGNKEGNVTNVPSDARLFEFDFSADGDVIGKVSCSLDNEKLSVIYSDNLVGDQDELTRKKWYDFLKGLREFSRARMIGFDVRNITKNANKRRDYEFLSSNRVIENFDLENYIENL